MRSITSVRFAAAALVVAVTAGCAVTEDAFKASSETLQNTSEASTDVTSSTSHKDKADKSHEVKEFSEHNFERLRENMSSGSGPHLAALAELLDIPQQQRSAFFQLTKAEFSTLFPSYSTSATAMLSQLEMQLEQHRELLRTVNPQ